MNKTVCGRSSTVTLQETPFLRESLFGAIYSEEECLKIIDMCRMNIIPRTKARLTYAERRTIRPGSIFVYEEEESGISRWTDGRAWSSSKIHGRCLVYYELSSSEDLEDVEDVDSLTSSVDDILKLGRNLIDRAPAKAERRKKKRHPSGLVKMTTSLSYEGKSYHLMSYTTSLFSSTQARGGIWNMVHAWEVPHNLHLRMSYRRKRSSFTLPDHLEPFPNLYKIKKREERRSNSCPIGSTSLATSNPYPFIDLPDDFLSDYYLQRDDFYTL
ncbi:hypothetical protein NEDG_00116 [Nematocida displodere]|uniref:Gti1/Pac2 family-domain-containing protein n=1 Tax=Nematocida displodere TaxID=1805483 RepID=A0A177EJJ3_9MICR|nr:hypothetical protein NEDG_00116 [Nematocida displodere]